MVYTVVAISIKSANDEIYDDEMKVKYFNTIEEAKKCEIEFQKDFLMPGLHDEWSTSNHLAPHIIDIIKQFGEWDGRWDGENSYYNFIRDELDKFSDKDIQELWRYFISSKDNNYMRGRWCKTYITEQSEHK